MKTSGLALPSGTPQSLNRVVAWDAFSHQFAIWHANDGGDVKELAFELPKKLKTETVEKAFQHYGRQWVDRLDRQDWQIVPKTLTCHGPYPSLDLDSLDMDVYVITLKAKRTKPLLMKGEQAEELMSTPPQGNPGVASIYREAMKAGPAEIERNARAKVAAQKEVGKVQEARKRQTQMRKDLGLPEYKPDVAKEMEDRDVDENQ